MAATLTKDDFIQLEKRFVTSERFEAVIEALKERIDQVELNITADITGAIDRAMQELIHRAEFENLKTRVGTLERKVS